MENSLTCDICNVNVHRASFVKHLRSKKHLESIKQNEMIIPEWLFKQEQTPNKNKVKKVYNPKTLKQIARENIKMNDKKLDKELAKKMFNPYYFNDEKLKNGLKINLKSHNISHAKSLINIIPNFPNIGIETRHVNKIPKTMATFYARLINQHKFKYHIFFSAIFYKLNEKIREVMKLNYSLI